MFVFFLYPIYDGDSIIGGVIQGRSIIEVFSIYFQQTNTHKELSVNYPSLWALLVENRSGEFYSDMHMTAVLLTVFIILVLVVILLYKAIKEYDKKELIEISFLLCYTCVFFLPCMHERYGYLYIMIGLITVIIQKKMIPVYILLLLIDVIIYSNYLFHYGPNWRVLAAINAVCYSYSVWVILRDAFDIGKCTDIWFEKKEMQ